VHRQALAAFIYFLETAALIGFLATGPPLSLILIGGIIIIIGQVYLFIKITSLLFSFVFFFCISYLGKRLCDQIESNRSDIDDASSDKKSSTISSTFNLHV
jgi:membrane protein implicated in regulation of membrane protease activity